MTEIESLTQAIADILADLPGLLADEWDQFEAQLLIRLRAIEAARSASLDDEFDRI